MKEIPIIGEELVASLDEATREKVLDGSITKWLTEQLDNLAANNPVLYKYIMSHTQRFASAVMATPDPQSISISLALEELLLLTLVGNSFKTKTETDNFVRKMNGWFGEKGIKGLEDLGNKDKDV